MEETDWLFELKDKVPQFLEKLKGRKIPGFFRYSLTGDLYDENIKWGLGNTVFAVKIYFTLNLLNEMPDSKRKEMADFIKSFQTTNGELYDPLVKRKALIIRILKGIKHTDLNNIFGRQTVIAESRQSISALKLLDERPDIPFQYFPRTASGIEKYLDRLNWENPWGAGSHFSHLVFFLKNSDLENKEDLIAFSINWVNKLQAKENGSWYKRNPTLQRKVNGAMKVITALKVANKMNFKHPDRLIDLCLSARNEVHACDNFNIVYVLKYANELTDGAYRYNEIREFALDRLRIYKTYYYPKFGGFSFLPNKTNDYYYCAKITKSLNEPDIHGTVMFTWGISVISQILGIQSQIGFKEQIP